MKKIFIIGVVASGTGRYKRSAEEQIEVIKEIDIHGTWIFEGTDRESYQCLYEMADTIIFLDTPLWTRRIRILKRFLKQNLGIEKCHYKPDILMLKMMYKWTRDFEQNRSGFEAKLKKYKEKVIRLSDNNNLDFT
ncbi:hypothetical protein AB4Z17_29510 [Paenibacillus sp. TAF43_2]|uniref:hypothetical protein n=1 Tax=Paenibacillus sp. TAF43_2 TaxID=3233069 RepID=UPI003F9881A9